jgi:hypothetical protein
LKERVTFRKKIEFNHVNLVCTSTFKYGCKNPKRHGNPLKGFQLGRDVIGKDSLVD